MYAELTRRGYAVWASSVHGDAVSIGDLDVSGKIALVFGNEHQGLSREAEEAAHGRFHVPMHGFVESLNVSVATAISMFDVLRRMRASNRDLGLPPLESKRLHAEWMALGAGVRRVRS